MARTPEDPTTAEAGETPEVTVDGLAAARDAAALVVDVRSPEEYAGGHVPGAINVALEDVVESPTRFGDREVHMVCGGGGRSFRAASAVNEAGGRALSVSGGTRGWIASGRAVEEGSGTRAGRGDHR